MELSFQNLCAKIFSQHSTKCTNQNANLLKTKSLWKTGFDVDKYLKLFSDLLFNFLSK